MLPTSRSDQQDCSRSSDDSFRRCFNSAIPIIILMDRQQQILTWTSAFLLGISLQRWFRQWRDGLKERLNSVLGRSAQWTAGMRAIESLETTDALFVDDMASDLAGKRTCKKALQLAEVRFSVDGDGCLWQSDSDLYIDMCVECTD